MKAFVIDRYGKRVIGRIADMPEPTLAADDVLVQVHAAGVNALDVKIRSGEFRLILPYTLPLILGNDVAGTVLEVGTNVTRFKPGDDVFARVHQTRIGTFAERIAINQTCVANKPVNLTMVQAASLPLVALTAWQVLVETAKLTPGQKVLIHAGSGGVGTVAIQLAKHLGAYVAATTSTANVEWVKALGADQVIDYTTQHFVEQLHDYDIVLNSLGPDVLGKSVEVLKRGGRLISISGPPTVEFATRQGLGWTLTQVLRVLSSRIRSQVRQRGMSYDFVFMRADGGQLGEIASLIEAGVITPVVEKVYPFEATADALAHVQSGRAKGKVVIELRRS
ncbi:NADP-dependent oxidoreductase [Pseudomonas sp. CFBP 8771]|uniref:NADP-dependent oxidoreductase n=1 Tax=Pseudomonas sp. CFBP 8771 TaxID=2775285 RepID=UPI001780DBC8|nr:NADP-dependent oxidoreductase [Pseudomonas sp. CFBP 8771]MBD8604886.1 NADP-dependent oxidoreductase [Pseudomonas sp. CFBP 8771]